ncbi:MAG: prenyltransferase [Firmicutes bacterium]|nr:prenyltransferase [Bacillota bacterium]
MPTSAFPTAPPLRARARDIVELIRPFSLSGATMPVLVTAAATLPAHASSAWRLLLVWLGLVAAQAACNVINEVYDVRNGVDTPETPCPSKVILTGRLSSGQALAVGLGLLGGGCAIGLVLSAVAGLWVLPFAAAGALGAYFYTAPPLNYKYRALGVPLIAILLGPLPAWAAARIATAHVSPAVMAASVPLGLLMAAALHANDVRDRESDRRSGARTLAARLSAPAGLQVWRALVFGAYAWVLFAVIVHWLPRSALLALLTLGAARRAHRDMVDTLASPRTMFPEVSSARLHLWMGLALAGGLVLAW